MKAPDKIYARIVAGKLYASREPHKIFDEPLPEYICKDALLEWAKERYKSTISNVGCYTGHSVWAEVIEKLESL